MPYSSIDDAKEKGWKLLSLDDVTLNIEQINYIAKIYDAVKSEGDVDNPMAVAIGQFKDEYEKNDGSWVKKKIESKDCDKDEYEACDKDKEYESIKIDDTDKTGTNIDDNEGQVDEEGIVESIGTIDGNTVTESVDDTNIRLFASIRTLEEVNRGNYRIARGSIGFIQAGKLTDNGTIYSAKCCNNIKESYAGMFNGRTKMPVRALNNDIVGKMKATHNSANGIGNEIMETVAYIKSFYHKRSDRILPMDETVIDDDVIGITFETVDSVFGEHVATLLDNGVMEGVSLNAIWEKRRKTNEAVIYDKLMLENLMFAVDFTGHEKPHSMNFSNPEDEQFKVTLEETQTKEKKEMPEEVKKDKEQVEDVQEPVTATKEEVDVHDTEEYRALEAQLAEAEKFRHEAIENRLNAKIKECLKVDSLDGHEPVKLAYKAVLENYKETAHNEDDPARAMEEYAKTQLDEFIKLTAEDEKIKQKRELEAINLNLKGKNARDMGITENKGEKLTTEKEDELLGVLYGSAYDKDGKHIYESTGWLKNVQKPIADARFGSIYGMWNSTPTYGSTMESTPMHMLADINKRVVESDVNAYGTYSTLYPDIMRPIMYDVMIRPVLSMFSTFLQSGKMNYTGRQFIQRKSKMHKFGTLAHGGSYTVVDGALTSEVTRPAFIEVTTVDANEVVVTVTGKDWYGNNLWGKCTIPEGAKVGYRGYFVPFGDNVLTQYKQGFQFNNITTAALSGSATLAINIGADATSKTTIASGYDLPANTDIHTIQNIMQEYNVAMQEFRMKSDISWNTIYDLNHEFANHSNMMNVADLVRQVSTWISHDRDKQGFEDINKTGFTDSVFTVDMTESGTPTEDLSKLQRNFIRAINQMKGMIKSHQQSLASNLVAIINPTDVDIFDIVNKFGNTYHRQSMVNPYEQGAYLGNYQGVDFYQSDAQIPHRIAFLDRTKSYDVVYQPTMLHNITATDSPTMDSYYINTRAAYWFPNAKHYHGIMVLGGRS